MQGATFLLFFSSCFSGWYYDQIEHLSTCLINIGGHRSCIISVDHSKGYAVLNIRNHSRRRTIFVWKSKFWLSYGFANITVLVNLLNIRKIMLFLLTFWSWLTAAVAWYRTRALSLLWVLLLRVTRVFASLHWEHTFCAQGIALLLISVNTLDTCSSWTFFNKSSCLVITIDNIPWLL